VYLQGVAEQYKKFLEAPPPPVDLQLSQADLATLASPSGRLNDEIINSAVRLAKEIPQWPIERGDRLPTVRVLPTYFATKVWREGYRSVANWKDLRVIIFSPQLN
jgi:Ulp1 family protease